MIGKETKMKRVIVLLLTAAIALSVTACGGGKKTEQTAEKQMQEQTDTAEGAFDFPDLGIKFVPDGVWAELRDNLLMQPVYGSEVDPVSGVMVDFGNDEAIEKAKNAAKDGKDGSDVEAMMWDNSKRLFAIAWVRTGEVPMDTVSNRRLSQAISADYFRRKHLSQSAVNEAKAHFIGCHRRLSRAYFSSAMAGLK